MPAQGSQKLIGSVSLDLDNLWSYMKIHGDDGWRERPSYLDRFVPHALGALEEVGLKITFFIVGVDAAEKANATHLQSIAAAGHEVGNHSFEHESWLQLYSRSQLQEEIDRSQAAIEKATGIRPVGFRGPGFSWSPTLLEVLAASGFTFDASTLPTYLGPIARLYYFRTAKISPEERQRRKELFGKFSDGLRPVKPYLWRLSGKTRLLEIPVTTIPILKLPFHLSYLLYLSRISSLLMRFYLEIAVFMCRLTRTGPSFLLHPLDLLGADDVSELQFFPGMTMSGEEKLQVFRTVFIRLARSFDLVPMGVHARHLISLDRLPERQAG